MIPDFENNANLKGGIELESQVKLTHSTVPLT